MSAFAFDPILAISTLARHEVRFVLVGGLAARLQGSTTVTNDIELCDARDPENLERLAAALRELGAGLRGAPRSVPFRLDAKALAAGGDFTFETRAGNLDILGTPAGAGGFEELERAADRMKLGGHEVAVASLEDLIEMKRAAGRPKDRVEVEILGALREEKEKRRRPKPRS
jgi:hypothetical protein